eukprot:s7157_g1.t1
MLMTISAASDDCDGGDYSEVVDENAYDFDDGSRKDLDWEEEQQEEEEEEEEEEAEAEEERHWLQRRRSEDDLDVDEGQRDEDDNETTTIVELDDLWSGDSGGYYYGGDGGGGGYGGYGGGYGGQRRILERISSTSSGRHLQGWPGGPGGPPGGGGGSLPTMTHTIVFDERSKEAIVYGGTTKDNTVSGEVFLYNMSSRTWRFKLMTFGPTSRYGHSACFDPIGRKMWVYGGVGSDASYQSDLWSFDTESLEWSVSWSLGPAGGIGQAGHSAVWDIQKTRRFV